MPKESPSSDVGDYIFISITSFLSKVFEKIVAEKLSHICGKEQSISSFSVFVSWGLGTCDTLLTLSLHVALDRGMDGRPVQLNFSLAINMVSHCGLLYKLRSMDFGGQFLTIVSEFLSD